MKKNGLFKIVSIMALTWLCAGCASKVKGPTSNVETGTLNDKSKPHATSLECGTYEFSIGADGQVFGYDYDSDVAVIQPRAIALSKRHIFISDPWQNNIKRIDAYSGELRSVGEIPHKLRFHSDLTIFQNKILVATSMGIVVVMSIDGDFQDTIRFCDGAIRFTESKENSLLVYRPTTNDVWSLSNNFKIKELPKRRISQGKSVQGKRMLWDSKKPNEMDLDFGKFELSHSYSINDFGGENLNYNHEMIAFFLIQDSVLKLNVCPIK